MPELGINLNHDQAEDLRQLITLTAIVQEWLHVHQRQHPLRPGRLRLPQHLPLHCHRLKMG